jgi:hypothetical protein
MEETARKVAGETPALRKADVRLIFKMVFVL